MFGLVVVTELNLTLISSKLAGHVKGDGMRSIQNVITGLFTHIHRHVSKPLSSTASNK